jgi:hypothetical protein
MDWVMAGADERYGHFSAGDFMAIPYRSNRACNEEVTLLAIGSAPSGNRAPDQRQEWQTCRRLQWKQLP